MRGRYSLGALMIILSCTVWSCEKSYQDLVEAELASGIRYDSVFLGINLNMDRKEFYSHCWELNKEGKVINGPSNLSVEYRLVNNEMRDSAYLRFYPDFDGKEINKMDFEFGFLNWAPWNEDLKIDSLLLDSRKLLHKWYGKNDFIYLEGDQNKKVWVKVDGNRRIRLWKADLRKVQGDMIDLTRIKEKNK
ncbi:MAG: hypothetical protein AAFQ94_23500 [Bacteroidota bacterium]